MPWANYRECCAVYGCECASSGDRGLTPARRGGSSAQEDGTRELEDDALLDRATELGEDLLREAAQRQERGEAFAGVIYAHQLKVTVGQCTRDLEVIALAGESEDFADRVEYLPLR